LAGGAATAVVSLAAGSMGVEAAVANR
jgi:hypothetical protein